MSKDCPVCGEKYRVDGTIKARQAVIKTEEFEPIEEAANIHTEGSGICISQVYGIGNVNDINYYIH